MNGIFAQLSTDLLRMSPIMVPARGDHLSVNLHMPHSATKALRL